MASFVSAAKGAGLHTIVAPDLSLASPALLTTSRGGETQNWQTYLRLGLAACAAAAQPNDYHIMSQTVESHWCRHQHRGCQGSESDFVNFVTQAGLQARAVDPLVQLSFGLAANPDYDVTAAQMYQDAVDVQGLVNNIWMNLVGPSAPELTLDLFNEIEALRPVTPRSSVLFAGNGSFGLTVPTASTPFSLDLSQPGATATFASAETVPGGTTIPAGDYELQYWTGPGRGVATVSMAFGYCRDTACTQRVPLIARGAWNAVLAPNQRGAATPGGALTTTSRVKIPGGRPHRLYWSVTATTPAAFSLLFGSASDPTNLATPVLFDVPSGTPTSTPMTSSGSSP
jgi:hypothetical protein